MTTSEHQLAIGELKKQAKRLRKQAGSDLSTDDPKHQQMLHEASRQAGFRDWQHARRVLGGAGRPGEDWGTFWIGRPGGGFLNEWFAGYEQARASWEAQSQAFLLPYKTQFVVVGRDLMQHAGIDERQLLESRDLIADREAYDRLSSQRLRTLFSIA